jgi:peptidoglycan/LPS O-acetylase OafA/YrhL
MVQEACENPKNIAIMERIDSLQGVRALAFLGIFLYHAIRTFPGECKVYTFFSTGLGPWGVSVFFVLSGFLMTYSYWNRPPQKTLKGMVIFALRKEKKLYLLHLIMLFFGCVYLILGHKSVSEIIKGLIITVPLMQTWSPIGYQAINTVAWYLSVSLFLYFVFPAILPIIKNRNAPDRIVMMVAIYFLQLIIGYCIARFTHVDVKWITYCHPLYRVGDFVIGGLMASFYINQSKSKRPSTAYGSFLEISAIFSIFSCLTSAIF